MVRKYQEIKDLIGSQRGGKRRRNGNLTSDGSIGANSSVSIRDQIEVNDGDEAIVEYLGEIIDDEVGAVGAQRLVIERERNPRILSGGNGGVEG